MGPANGSYLHKENILPIISLSLIFLNVIKAITGQRNIQAAQEAKTFNICRQKYQKKVFSENRKTDRDNTLLKVQLLIRRRRSSEKQENDLSI